MAAILQTAQIEDLRRVYPAQVQKTEAEQICAVFGFGGYKARVALYGDRRRGIKPLFPPLNGKLHRNFSRMWSRDVLIEELNRG